MASLINYLSLPIRKLFSTPDFTAAARRSTFVKPSSVSYPFMWYPEAGITSAGPKFKYADGTELISYHIKGIYSINSVGGSGFAQYLCTINFPDGEPFIMPGSITGMFQYDNSTFTPITVGGMLKVDGHDGFLTDFSFQLQPYENPQPDGSYNYALVAGASVTSGSDITGLMAYDFEFLLPNDTATPTIFQD